MATTSKKTTTSKQVAKPKASAKGNLGQTNKKVTTQKVVIHRKLKYQYPKGCKDTVKRKSFRQTVRERVRKLERDITKLKGEDKKILAKELSDYMAKYLT